jgi:glycerophosphoryl diester phosphodiesterase
MHFRLAWAIATIAVVCSPGLLSAQVTWDARFADAGPPAIAANRAIDIDSGLPEQSLAAFQAAIDAGYGIIPVYTEVTRDGVHVVMHDVHLNRTTNVAEVFPDGSPDSAPRGGSVRRDFVKDYTLASLRQLRLTDGAGGGDHRIPTLDEALDLIDGRALVWLIPATSDLEALAATLETHGTGNILVYGRSHAEARALAEATGLKTSTRLSKSTEPLAKLDSALETIGPALAMVTFGQNQFTPELVARLQELGLPFCYNGMGYEDTALRSGDLSHWADVLQSGAVAVLTDHADALLDLRDGE